MRSRVCSIMLEEVRSSTQELDSSAGWLLVIVIDVEDKGLFLLLLLLLHVVGTINYLLRRCGGIDLVLLY